MPPTFLIFLFVVTVLPVLLVLGAIFGLCYGLYRWRRRLKRTAELIEELRSARIGDDLGRRMLEINGRLEEEKEK